MTNNPINYPFLVGSLEGRLETLAYTLTSKGIVSMDKYEELKEFITEECNRIRQLERNYTNGTQLP